MRFQDLFHSLPGFFSPFPHGTCSLSVDYEYLALEDGPPSSDRISRVPPYLSSLSSTEDFSHTGLSPTGQRFQAVLISRLLKSTRLFRFRSPLLSESRLMSFLELLRCFSSLVRLAYLCIQLTIPLRWVSPFGYLRIKANLPAPRSFSQAITSFIACNRQGIHHMHLVT